MPRAIIKDDKKIVVEGFSPKNISMYSGKEDA